MSKKDKSRCAYCSNASAATADHVFARNFFLVEHRDNLPQVPACAICNGEKSKLEHYLTAVLPFGGRHKGAQRHLAELVPKRLAKNVKLHRSLRLNWGRVWTEEGGLHVPAATLPVRPEAVEDLFRYIVRGLAFYHWRVRLTDEHDVDVIALTKAGERFFDQLLALRAGARVDEDLGDGTFTYEGSQSAEDPTITVWRIRPFGGVKFGDGKTPGKFATRIGALTGPSSIALGRGHSLTHLTAPAVRRRRR